MLKWINQVQTVRVELQKMWSAKTPKELEQTLETFFEKLSTSPNFLNVLSLALNTQSYAKSFINDSFETVWKNIQLPNKKDQERTLYLLHDLQFKISQIERNIDSLKKATHPSVPIKSNRANDSRLISVAEKRSSDNKVAKLV